MALLTPNQLAEVLMLCRQGDPLMALARFRQATGASLADAKQFLDGVQQHVVQGRPRPDPPPALVNLPEPLWRRVCYLLAQQRRSEAVRAVTDAYPHWNRVTLYRELQTLGDQVDMPVVSETDLLRVLQALLNQQQAVALAHLQDCSGMDAESATAWLVALQGGGPLASAAADPPASKSAATPASPLASDWLPTSPGRSGAGYSMNAHSTSAKAAAQSEPDDEADLPEWCREARRRKIRRIILYYHKADGLMLDPTNLDYPVLIGGDYDGPRPYSAEAALRYLSVPSDRPASRQLLALVPFLQRMVNGESFSLDELLRACGGRIR